MSKALRKELSCLGVVGAAGLFLAGHRHAAAVAGIGAALLRFWPARSHSFAGKVAVVTGGSSGLGFVLAENLLREGAEVVILARDPVKLLRAGELLEEWTGREPILIHCDVTRPDALRGAFRQVEALFGGLDFLFNNAGAITIGPWETMNHDDFQDLLDLEVHAVLGAVENAMPLFSARGGGQVVNICSVGGKIPVPHLGPYCTAKFALAGLSAAMGTELAAKGVKVLTVFPGLMRTGSPGNATVKGDHEKEFAWFAAGAVAPILSISAPAAAERIVRGIREGASEIVFPSTTRLAVLGVQLFPETSAAVLRLAGRFFPNGGSNVPRKGCDCQGWLEKQSWYRPLRPIMEEARAAHNQSWDGARQIGS